MKSVWNRRNWEDLIVERVDAERVLVTGGRGFIGSYIVRELLNRGRQVSIFARGDLTPESRFIIGPDASAIPVELGSVEDLPRLIEAVKKTRPDAIVHAASSVDTGALYRNPYLAFRAVLEGAINVFEAARIFDVKRVVHLSSIGVLPTVQYQPIDAAHPFVLAKEGPASGGYGVAKAAGELFGFAYRQAYGLDVRTIRPSAVYGFGMRWHSANYMKQFVEPAVRGEPVRLDHGGALPRDYTHVLDVASLTAAVLDAPDDADRTFYAATGQPLVTASQAAKLVMRLVPGADIEISEALDADDLTEVAFRGVLSIRNAQEQLKWEPAYRSLSDGIAEYIARYRAFLDANLA
jgi:nucleoside-diphosphate-sugar epimerase